MTTKLTVTITEQDLAEASCLEGGPANDSHTTTVAEIVLSRAGQATPAGRYRLVDGEWLQEPSPSDLDRMLDEVCGSVRRS